MLRSESVKDLLSFQKRELLQLKERLAEVDKQVSEQKRTRDVCCGSDVRYCILFLSSVI